MTTSILSDAARGEVGLFVAQSLVTAFAHGDWEAARTISPQLPEWSDAKYAKGFAGLDEAFMTSSDSLIWGQQADTPDESSCGSSRLPTTREQQLLAPPCTA